MVVFMKEACYVRCTCCSQERVFRQPDYSAREASIETKETTQIPSLVPYKDYTCNLSHPIYESSLRAGHGRRESLDRHQRCLKLLDCGRLGRQAADHPWSALRVVKSCRKDCPTASVLLEAKAAALHPERYQSSLSKLSKRAG